MKELLLTLLFSVLSSSLVSAQSFFKDTSFFYTGVYYGHEGPDEWGMSLIREKIIKKDVIGDTTLYSYSSDFNKAWNNFGDTLELLECDNKLFLKGDYRFKDVRYVNNQWIVVDSIIHFNNYLLFDFTLAASDTFWIEDPFGYRNSSWLSPPDSFVVVSSIDSVTLANDQLAFTYKLEPNNYYINEINQFTAASSGPLIFFRPYRGETLSGYSESYEVLAICGDNEELYKSQGSKWPYKHFISNVCETDSMEAAIAKTLSIEVSSESKVSIWPNPCTTVLHFNGDTEAAYSIYNHFGQEVKYGKTNELLNVADLAPGIYTIQLVGRTHNFYRKIIKQ